MKITDKINNNPTVTNKTGQDEVYEILSVAAVMKERRLYMRDYKKNLHIEMITKITDALIENGEVSLEEEVGFEMSRDEEVLELFSEKGYTITKTEFCEGTAKRLKKTAVSLPVVWSFFNDK